MASVSQEDPKALETTSNQTILKERLVNLLLESKPTNTAEQLYLVIEQCFSYEVTENSM